MNTACSFLTGAGLGAGLMYMLDPQMGGRRRALARDKMVRLSHEAQDAACVVGKDFRNKAQGLASGDLTTLVGGKRALEHPFTGGWSPSGRALMAGLGAGLFVYGLTRSAPMSCLLGTLGCVLAAEGITNTGIDDITEAAGEITERAKHLAGRAGFGKRKSREQSAEMMPAGEFPF